MAELAKTDDVDHHVLAELQAEFQRQLGRQHHGFGVITVHVQYRRFDHLDDVRTVQGRAAVTRVTGGETNLVVDDDMHRAARVIPTGLGQGQRLHHNALPSECCVTVHQHRQNLLAVGVAAPVHTSPN